MGRISNDATCVSGDLAGSGTDAGIDLIWLPLGAGGHSVRWNGRVYEAVTALLQRRAGQDLYHSALRVSLPPDVWVVEMTPEGAGGDARGVVAGGCVGSRRAGRSRLFRYEVRRWRGGSIGDVREAVASPDRICSDEATCRNLIASVPLVPTPVWGRDELGTGDMWNSNSLTSWALARAGVDVQEVGPPLGGRAPGWKAGLVVSARQGAVPRRPATERR